MNNQICIYKNGIVKLVKSVERKYMVFTIAFTLAMYLVRYFNYDATPGNAPMDHPMGWWGWFDQGKYLQSVNAFYAGNLDPINHFYPPLYPLLGVLGRWISSGHPFFFINLASYCIYALCFTKIANQYFSRVASVAIWIAISLGSIYVVDLFVIPWTTSLQSCIISISFVYILRISHRPAINQRFPNLEAAFAGLAIGLLVANRPGDIPISLILLGFCVYQLLSRKNNAELNGRYQKVGLIIGAWIVGLLVLCFINNAIYGSILGSYVQAAGANGYFPGEFLNKFVSLFIESKSLFLESGLSIIDVIPWMPIVIAGALSFLVIGKGILRTAVLVSSGYFALFIPYGDLLPNGMWRYLNFHYFAWTVPYFVLAFFAFLKQIYLSRKQFKYAAVVLSTMLLISIYSVGFKTNYSDVGYFKVESGISIIEFPRQESINFIDFPDLKSDFRSAYFGNNQVSIDGVEQKMVHDFRLIESEGVVRLLFQKRINADKIQVIFDENIEILDTRFRVGRVNLTGIHDRNSNNEFPISLNSEIQFNEAGSGGKYLEEGWSNSESWGTWSNSERAYLRIPIDQNYATFSKVTIKYIVFLPENHCQLVQVFANKKILFQQNYCGRSGANTHTNSFWITEDMYFSDAEVLLTFNLPDAISPFEFKLNNDTRTLSVGILSMKIDTAK